MKATEPERRPTALRSNARHIVCRSSTGSRSPKDERGAMYPIATSTQRLGALCHET
jgi:hypothetical protein